MLSAIDVSVCLIVAAAAAFNRLLSVLILLQLLNFVPLFFDLMPLRIQLALRHRVLFVLLLKMMADRIAANTSNARADKSARDRVMYGGADDRTRATSDQDADTGAFLGVRKLRPGNRRYECDGPAQCQHRDPILLHCTQPPNSIGVRLDDTNLHGPCVRDNDHAVRASAELKQQLLCLTYAVEKSGLNI
jgi:hypothetical protein